MKKLIGISVVLMFLTGCVVVSDYQPIAGNSFGYSEQRLNENTYEVSFKGHKRTSQEEANDFALLRGLEIAKTLDYDFMLVTSTKDKTSSSSRTSDRICYPNVYGEQVCSGGRSYRSTYPGITIKVQFFDKKPTGRYLPESLLVVDTSYVTLSEKYGLEVAKAAAISVKKSSAESKNPVLRIAMQKLYTQEKLTEGGWDLSACSNLPPSTYNTENKDNLLSILIANDTGNGIYDAYVDLRGNIKFLKSRNAGESYRYTTYLGTNWIWFTDGGTCLGWTTATNKLSETSQRISQLTESQ